MGAVFVPDHPFKRVSVWEALEENKTEKASVSPQGRGQVCVLSNLMKIMTLQGKGLANSLSFERKGFRSLSPAAPVHSIFAWSLASPGTPGRTVSVISVL